MTQTNAEEDHQPVQLPSNHGHRSTATEEEDQEPIDTDQDDDSDQDSIHPTQQRDLYSNQPITNIPSSNNTHTHHTRQSTSDVIDPSYDHPTRAILTTSTPSREPSEAHPLVWTSPNSDIIDRSLIYESTTYESPNNILPSPPPSPSPNPNTLTSIRRRVGGRSRSKGRSDKDEDRVDANGRSPSSSSSTHSSRSSSLSFSLWDQFKYQLHSSEHDQDQSLTGESSSSAALRSERIANFLHVPLSIERLIYFGFFICLDSFLSVITILPIKFVVSLIKLVSTITIRTFLRLTHHQHPSSSYPSHKRRNRLSVSSKVDLMQGLLIIMVCVFLHHVTDASRMYHSVRGQETIKLYVIFNVLEIADRLCCSFGQDILDSLFSPSTLGRRIDGSQPHMKPLFLFILAFIFTVAHTLVLFYQLVSLNVAINSFDHSLMTLLISNQFVEIKGAVFKKFEKENLFQMSCADIVERFQLFLMLTIIALRNWIEMSGSSTTSSRAFSYTYQYLPISLSNSRALALIEDIVSPVIVVMLSEILVDWLKHAFITKFNHIRPSVYGRFIDVLCKDLVDDAKTRRPDKTAWRDGKMKPFLDKSPAVSRRLGFSVFPIFCLTVRVLSQALNMLSDTSDEEFKLVNDENPDRLFNDYGSRFSLEYIKQQLLAMVPNPKMMLSTDPPKHADPSYRNSSIQPESSAFSNFQMKGSIILSFLIVMTFLTFIKLYLGIRIRSYSIHRVKTLNQRLEEDQLNGRDRLPIGLSETEILREKNERKLIERVEFDVPLRPKKDSHNVINGNNNSSGVERSFLSVENGSTNRHHPSIQNPSSSSHGPVPFDSSHPPNPQHTTKNKLTMDELSRFDMVRSRIW